MGASRHRLGVGWGQEEDAVCQEGRLFRGQQLGPSLEEGPLLGAQSRVCEGRPAWGLYMEGSLWRDVLTDGVRSGLSSGRATAL